MDTSADLAGLADPAPALVEPDFQAFPAPESAPGPLSLVEPQKRRNRGKGSPALRRPVERALAVSALPAQISSLLGQSLGLDASTTADVVELAVESLARERQGKSTIATLMSLAKTDAMEAGVSATELAADKAEFKKVWGLTALLDDNLPAAIPAAQAKAGLALARAAQGFDSTSLGLLAKAQSVLDSDY
jgi:hypothetical protein